MKSAASSALVVLLALVGRADQGATNPAQTPAFRPALNGAVTGNVVDGSSGTPLADVIVTILPATGSSLPSGYQPRQITDSKGRFAFMQLPDGHFQIQAGKYGYLDGGYGRDSGPTDELRPIVVSNGSWVSNLRATIWKPAALSGTVRDESGEPVVGVLVRAIARIQIGGRDEFAAGPITVTDDYGRYRISGLLPGRYLVQVPSVQMSMPAGTRVSAPTGNTQDGVIDVDDSSRLAIGRYPLPPPRSNGRAMTYGVTFCPDARLPAEATVIELQYGVDRPGADVTLTPVPAVRVSGVVEGPPESLANLTVRLLPAGMENLGLGSETATALVGQGGTFTFLNVPAGSYTLDAPITFNELKIASGASRSGGFVSFGSSPGIPTPPPRAGLSTSSQETGVAPGVSLSSADFRGAYGGDVVPNYVGRTTVTVGSSDVGGAVLRLRPTAVVNGRIVVESDSAKPIDPATRASVLLDPADGRPGLGQPRATISPASANTFQLTRVMSGEYFLRVQGFSGTPIMVKSVQWQGREYATAPLDTTGADELSIVVTLTTALPSVTGSVRTTDGAMAQTGLVIVFPTQDSQRIKTGLWPINVISAPLMQDGAFKLEKLPAGDYFIVAIDVAHRSSWRDPKFLSLIERQATRMTVAWGQTLRQDLTMAVIR